MKKLFLLLIVGIATLACRPVSDKNKENVIGPDSTKLKEDRLTAELMWSFGRISEIKISPDGKQCLFGVAWYNWKENKGNRELYLIGVDGSNRRRITETPMGEYNAVWRPDGKKIAFLYPDTAGNMQIFEMESDGKNRQQISDLKGGVNGFIYSPDQKNIAYIQDVKSNTEVTDVYPDLDKADARLISNMMFRHWDHWVTSVSHLFVGEYTNGRLNEGKDLLKGEMFDTPLAPFGGMEQITWSPDGKQIVYTCRKKTGKEYSLSTNSDLYLYNLSDGKTKNLTEGMLGYDQNPVFSPDGKKLAWESMARDGYESDKTRLFVIDLSSGEKIYVTAKYDSNAENIRWSPDSKQIYFISPWHGRQDIYTVTLGSDSVKKLTNGDYDYVSFELAPDRIIGAKHSISKPDEIYTVDLKTGKDQEISKINKFWLDQIKMGKVEERWITTTDKKKMLVWVIYPPHFDPSKKYPALLYCQGGPQGMVGQFWSYRWNFQMMAAHDYIVVAPNRRGMPGYGQEWLEQISGDYGGQNMKDYLTAIDSVSAEPFVDKDHMGAVGASYGGFSVYWLAGNHQNRFKAFIAHDGMFNLESQYLETEELWFVNWDLGGPYWDKNNAVAQKSYANSPHLFVKNWNTPILIFHGETDYRIAYTQAIQAFQAAQLMGVPSRLVTFPKENHWVLKPQNSILWQREFFAWLDKYLKPAK